MEELGWSINEESLLHPTREGGLTGTFQIRSPPFLHGASQIRSQISKISVPNPKIVKQVLYLTIDYVEISDFLRTAKVK